MEHFDPQTMFASCSSSSHGNSSLWCHMYWIKHAADLTHPWSKVGINNNFIIFWTYIWCRYPHTYPQCAGRTIRKKRQSLNNWWQLCSNTTTVVFAENYLGCKFPFQIEWMFIKHKSWVEECSVVNILTTHNLTTFTSFRATGIVVFSRM